MEKHKKTKDNTGLEGVTDTIESPTTNNTSKRPDYKRLTAVEIQRRVDECILLRYKADKPILQREWIDYCKEKWGDKSVPQFLNYWVTAKEQYEEGWRGSLENLIEPAIDVLREGLSSDNHYVRSKTIDQIWKMSGNDIQKHLVKGQIENITIGFQED